MKFGVTLERGLTGNKVAGLIQFRGTSQLKKHIYRRDTMDTVRLGIVGMGNMGTYHIRYRSQIKNMTITAVCDILHDRADAQAAEIGCHAFYDAKDMIRSGEIDAVLIATPHYSHTTIGIDALAAGLHVLVEKPLSVHVSDCLRLIAARKNKKQVFAAMFNQRTDPHYTKVKKLIEDGELGEIVRVNWIITNWFRPECYYASGSWRATWAGEGGGVLMNQSPHNIDLLQWLCGMPTSVTAFCHFGKWHNIEVEDEVTAYLEYPNGATGIFITSTGEAPGTNRLEICGERGKVVVENGTVHFTRNSVSSIKFLKSSDNPFAAPEIWEIDISVSGNGGQHAEVLQNFIDAILKGTPLIAAAEEGIRSVELANAMVLSSKTGKKINLPINGRTYETMLKKLIASSTIKKKVSKVIHVNTVGSFGKV